MLSDVGFGNGELKPKGGNNTYKIGAGRVECMGLKQIRALIGNKTKHNDVGAGKMTKNKIK
jgi:hypothetical protein